ncbi:MAG: LLM class flavin-dependent oxidoreductase, partial [Gammaproteobacteria bacterium]|nr:LLM class flavin-dependent oxidoreductase [Gammaproteobacteria bacterium]
MNLKVGVLDQSPIVEGGDATRALRESVELAQFTEALGYHRYWVAEHHSSASFAGCAPEILIGHIATHTNHIRVGSGGVMLMHYSPLKVAETFKLLATLHPGRIDLGIGRAPGSDGLTAAALAYGSKVGMEYFAARFADLLAFVHDTPTFTEALNPVKALPVPEVPPETWVLGSTPDGAMLAAHFGAPFCYAHFISQSAMEKALQVYRRDFRPSAFCPAPRVGVGVAVICAETEDRAMLLARSGDLWRTRFETGQFTPFPSLDSVRAHHFSEAEEKLVEGRRRRQFIGTPESVGASLRQLVADTGADELSIVAITHDFEDRKAVYSLLAPELG